MTAESTTPEDLTPENLTAEGRYELLAVVEATALEELADRILSTADSVEVLAGPEPVSAPLRYSIPGTKSTSTVLGHLALTTCSVLLDGTRGDGIRSGRDLTGAVAAAVCDAEVERTGPLTEEVLALCRAAAADRTTEARSRAALVDGTRVGAAS